MAFKRAFPSVHSRVCDKLRLPRKRLVTNRAGGAHLTTVLLHHVLLEVATGGEQALAGGAREFGCIMRILSVLLQGCIS